MASVKKGQTIEKKEKQSVSKNSSTVKSQKVTPKSKAANKQSSGQNKGSTKAYNPENSAGANVYDTFEPVSHTAIEAATQTPLHETDFAGRYRPKDTRKEDDFSRKAISGLISYETDRLRTNAEEREKSSAARWLEGISFQASPDAPMAAHGFQNSRKQYALDKSYKQITQDWHKEDRMLFGYLYSEDPKKAEEFAATVNDAITTAKTAAERERIRSYATSGLRNAVNQTENALAASILFSTPEFIDRIAEFSVRGRTTAKNYISPLAYSQEVVSGISDQLNGVDENGVAHNVLNESIPVIGGKGWGDVYKLGFHIAENWISANTIGRAFGATDKVMGKAAVLANAFSRAAAHGVDSSRKAGGDGKQSMAMGTTLGMLEVASEILPLEDLMKIGPTTTVKDFLKNVLKQSGLESVTEGLNEALGQTADYLIMGDLSAFSQRRQNYMFREGMTQEQASKQALRDSLRDLGYTMLAGAASGAVGSASQTALENTMADGKAGASEISGLTNPRSDTVQGEARYSVADLQTAKQALRDITQSYARLTPEGQKKWRELEDRYNAIASYFQNRIDATAAEKARHEAIRQQIRDGTYQQPFSPELYRMAVEMAAPNGYGRNDNPVNFAAAVRNERRNPLEDFGTADLETSENTIAKSVENAYNKVNGSAEGNRLRFMSHRDQFYKNLENVEPLPGYQDVACHADEYSFAAQDPETEEMLLEMDAKELAYRIIDSGKYTGEPIRLLACNSGVLEEGIAQQLADLLHVPILAPTNTVFTSADGYVAVAEDYDEAVQIMSQMSNEKVKFMLDGWKLFTPKGE